jgi:hypothetical protein
VSAYSSPIRCSALFGPYLPLQTELHTEACKLKPRGVLSFVSG